jgi:hypothetical protein
MATPKTPEQHRVNAELKKINPQFEVFTEAKFRTNADAKQLLYMYSDDYANEIKGTAEEILEQSTALEVAKTKLLYKIANVPYPDTMEMFITADANIYNSTAKFFGIKHRPLIRKLQHEIYHSIIVAQRQCDDGLNCINEYQEHIDNLQDWLDFCTMIESFKKYVESIHPNWNTISKANKNEYIKTINKLQDAPFIDKNKIKPYIDFLQNCGLNQTKKYKANYLYELGFPNITSINIAVKVYELTNLKIYGIRFS